MSRRGVIIGLTLLQAAVLISLLAWWGAAQHRWGWAGLGYTGVQAQPGLAQRLVEKVVGPAGKVWTVVPGSPADRAGIRQGDVLESINGLAIGDQDEIRSLAAQARRGDQVVYGVARDDSRFEVSVSLDSPYHNPVLLAGAFVSLVCGLLYLLISFLVVGARPPTRAAWVFYLLCAVGAFLFFVWAGGEPLFPDSRGLASQNTDPFWPVIMVVFAAAGCIVGNLLLHLALVFPRPRPVVRRWPGTVTWVHAAPFLPILGVAAAILGFLATAGIPGRAALALVLPAAIFLVGRSLWRSARKDRVPAALANRPWTAIGLILLLLAAAAPAIRLLPRSSAMTIGMFLGLFLGLWIVGYGMAYGVLTCIALIRSYRESGLEEKRQIWWPIWGTTTAMAGSLVISAVILALSAADINVTDTPLGMLFFNSSSKLLLLLIPVAFAFGIVKHRLMDIEIIVRKTVVYSAVTGIVVTTYLALSGAAGLALVRWAGLDSQLATVMTTVAVVALLVPIRNRVQGFVDSRFFRRERRREKAALNLPRLIADAASSEEMLTAVAEQVQQALHSRSVVVFHRPRTGEGLVVGATVGIPDPLRNRLEAPPSDLLTWNTSGDAVSAPQRPVWAVLAAPARSGGESVGVLAAGAPLGGEPYGPEDQSFLHTAASHLAAALAAREAREAEREFAQARVIQQGLLPRELPEAPGLTVAAAWRPAREVGGDYYDALTPDGPRLLVGIGDVSGKGMAAALLMSSLQAALRAVAAPGAGPAAICSQVRSVVCRALSGGRFVTFFLAVLDAGAGTVTYTNAGHVPAILVRADGSCLRLERGGPAMARVLEAMPYAEHSARLGPGDRLVLATDGITEAENGDGELFSEERLLALVREHRHLDAAGLLDEITRSVEVFAGNRRNDDLTLVVVAA